MRDDRLISLNAAIDAFKKALTVGESKGNYVTICSAIGYEGAKHILESLPTVDAVKVVRCKDCKHNPKLEWFGCPMASLSEKQRPETAWCWKGERKDDDNG